MPKKTKSQKKLADSRRVIAVNPLPKSETNKEKTTEPISAPVILTDYELKLRKFTLADLKKTAVIMLFLFALEFVFFYAKLKGILN